jgi:hypothetical protein
LIGVHREFEGMRVLPIVVSMLAAALQLTPARAGTVASTPVERGMIVVVADNATIDEVLTGIGERFGFSVERVSSERDKKMVSGRFVGTPDQLVTQMLRGQGHIVVRLADAPAGIGRILLLGSSEPIVTASPPPPAPQVPVAADPTNPVTPGKPSPGGTYARSGHDETSHAGPALAARPAKVAP